MQVNVLVVAIHNNIGLNAIQHYPILFNSVDSYNKRVKQLVYKRAVTTNFNSIINKINTIMKGNVYSIR